VSEREKYRLIAMYHNFVTGDLDSADKAYEMWRQSYPRDWLAIGNLGSDYMVIGQWENARRAIQESVGLEPNGIIGQFNLASSELALGRPQEARALNQEFPRDTMMQGYWLPSIRAAIELHQGHGAKAIDALQPASSFELGQVPPFAVGLMYPAYLRGEAYLLERQGREAAREFQKFLDHPESC
jgi:tetratricopeptide (TPR) repeat protein